MTVEEVWDAQESIYDEMQKASDEYCHSTSFRWGFEQGVDWCEMKLLEKLSQLLDNADVYDLVTFDEEDKPFINKEKFIENFKKTLQ